MPAPRQPVRNFALLAGVLGLLLLAGLHYGLHLSWGWAFLAAVNAVTFALYAYDKRVSGGEWARVPELVLHLLAAVGGSPAALLAQHTLRHKTRKGAFQRVFWVVVLVQVFALGWYVARS